MRCLVEIQTLDCLLNHKEFICWFLNLLNTFLFWPLFNLQLMYHIIHKYQWKTFNLIWYIFYPHPFQAFLHWLSNNWTLDLHSLEIVWLETGESIMKKLVMDKYWCCIYKYSVKFYTNMTRSGYRYVCITNCTRIRTMKDKYLIDEWKFTF